MRGDVSSTDESVTPCCTGGHVRRTRGLIYRIGGSGIKLSFAIGEEVARWASIKS